MTTKLSVWIRRTEHEGLFSIIVGGTDVDFAHLGTDHDTLFKFIRDVSSRQDLEFGNIVWKSEFRCTKPVSLGVIVLIVTSCRPNIRMVNKFGEGRAFLVGGKRNANCAIEPPDSGSHLVP